SLGTTPGSVILSIAAVEFDIETGETGNEFLETIDLEDSMAHGFTINPKTLKWWLTQNTDVMKKNINMGQKGSVKEVMSKLEAYFKYVYHKDIKVWGNSNRFDLGLLEPYTLTLGRTEPFWKFRNERDVRTLVAFRPEIKEEEVLLAKQASQDLHDPLVDC